MQALHELAPHISVGPNVKKSLSALHQRVLGHPFVYERVRVAVLGLHLGRLYDMLDDEARRAVVDIGCGTGDALNHLTGFERYLGVDIDPVPVEAARRRWGARPNVRFEARELRADDVAEFSPTGAILSGVLHHLTDEEAVSVLRLAATSPRLRQVVTTDIVCVPGKLINNVLAKLDRGRYCREPEAYAALAERAGLVVDKGFMMGANPNNERVVYWTMSLRPGG